jgi:microcystin-dependent protein
MTEQFVGEIRAFAFNFAPQGWAMCEGQLLPIQQNTALFSLIGTYYGGNGTINFQLPDLRSRRIVGQGQGNGLSPYVIGQLGGVENVTLNQSQMPSHSHAVGTTTADATSGKAVNNFNAPGGQYAGASDGSLMNAAMIHSAGGGVPFEIIEPYLAMTYCIALQGIFPSRN